MDEIQKLAAYEKMKNDILDEYNNICSVLEQLKAEGKIKTVTYRESKGRQYFYKSMLDTYDKYGLL